MPVIKSIEQSDLVAAIEQTTEGIIITDTRGMIRYVNPAFTTMTGYTSEDVLGQSTRILKSGRQPAAFYEDLWNTIRSGRVWDGDMINRRKDGILYEEEMRITPVKDSHGEVVGYIAIKHDVSRRRMVENAKRGNESCFRRVFESAPFGMFVSKPHEHFIQVNAAFCRMVGYSERELLGTAWTKLVHPDDLGRILQKSVNVWEARDICADTETRYIHHNENLVSGRVRIVLADDLCRNPLHLVFYVEDITDRAEPRSIIQG
jgi:PAS domain S-box-containing protein